MPIKKITIILLVAILMLELTIRVIGVTNFPLYEANNQIGYIPKSSQSGKFLNKNEWSFNALHMGTKKEFLPTLQLDTLLIGDSIVAGGNPLDEPERLAPLLQSLIGGQVWPISAGSWSLRNELIYLKQNPDEVAGVDQIIFILNSGDFAEASSWACETTHPLHKPLSALIYVLKKYVYNWQPCKEALAHYKVAKGQWEKELADLMATKEIKNKTITFFLYPNKTELASVKLQSRYLQYASLLKQITHANIFNVDADSRWHMTYYRDGIHPSGKGNQTLAKIIQSPDKQTQL